MLPSARTVAFTAPQAHGGDGRCGVTVLDFSQGSVEVSIERPRGLISHDLASIKGNGRYQFLRDMPPSPPPQPQQTRIGSAVARAERRYRCPTLALPNAAGVHSRLVTLLVGFDATVLEQPPTVHTWLIHLKCAARTAKREDSQAQSKIVGLAFQSGSRPSSSNCRLHSA
jgi:hypothetical protein